MGGDVAMPVAYLAEPRILHRKPIHIPKSGALRTAAGLAMSRRAAETYMQRRSMVEYAAYAVHIHRDSSPADFCLNRRQDQATRHFYS